MITILEAYNRITEAIIDNRHENCALETADIVRCFGTSQPLIDYPPITGTGKAILPLLVFSCHNQGPVCQLKCSAETKFGRTMIWSISLV